MSTDYLAIPGLDEVVGAMPRDLAEWAGWRSKVLRYREHVWESCERDRAERQRQLAKCAESRDYFLSVFGFIYEPRADPKKATRAYIPYPRQVELGRTLDWCLEQTGPAADLLVSKSRDVGASWYMIGDDLWRWRFLPTYQGRLVSRNEKLVDEIGNPDSLFWKLEFLLQRVPEWMLPPGFNFRKHRLRLRLLNPATGSAILGEATSSQAGRGGRATIRKYDEAAFIENFESVWDAAGNSTEHRVAISSESLEEDDGFFNIEHGRNGRTPPTVFGFDWHQVPGHDDAWYADMQTRLSPDAFQREVLRNAQAGLGLWVYPEARLLNVGDYPYVEGWPLYVAIDDGFDDDTSIHWLQTDPTSRKVRVVESYHNNHKPIDFYGSLMRGIPEDRFMRDYDARDYRLMEFTRGHWTEAGLPKAIYFGDHHGANTDLSSGIDPFQRLTNQYGIFVITNPMRRDIKNRRDALHALLINRMDFNDTEDVRRTLLALQEYRYPRNRSGETQSESKLGVHSWASHPVTALEYFAVNEVYAADAPLAVQRKRARRDPYGFGYDTNLEVPRQWMT